MKTFQLSAMLTLVALNSACGGGSGVTSSATSGPWEVAIAGDMAYRAGTTAAASAAEKTAQLVERLKLKTLSLQVLTTGDNVYSVGSEKEFNECYSPTWGRLKSYTLPAPGNHDYGTPNASAYYDYFGAAAGPDRRGYYRIDRSGWTLFSLNSNIAADETSPQYIWLKAELAKVEPCLAVIWHHPRFTSAARGNNLMMDKIWTLLQANKADVVFQGHEHHYERFAAMSSANIPTNDGIRSFVVGTGGAPLSDFASQATGSEKQVKSFGVMTATLSATGKLDYKFIDTNDAVRDSGSVTCKAKS